MRDGRAQAAVTSLEEGLRLVADVGHDPGVSELWNALIEELEMARELAARS